MQPSGETPSGPSGAVTALEPCRPEAASVDVRDGAPAGSDETGRRSERRWRELYRTSPVGIAIVDDAGLVIAANPSLCALVGRPEADVVGRVAGDFLHPEDRSTREVDMGLVERSPDGVLRIERRFLCGDGEYRWAALSVHRMEGDGVDEPWTLVHAHDITERRTAAMTLARSESDLRAVAAVVKKIQSGGDARQTIVDSALGLADADDVALLEPDGDELVVRASTSPGLVGARLALSGPAVSVEAFTTGRDVLSAGPDRRASPEQPDRSIYALPIRAVDEAIGVLAVGWTSPLVTLDGPRASVVRLLADQAGVALRQAALVAEMAGAALTDPLTGLPNRRHWDQRLRQLLSLTDRSQLPLTVAIADLDHFKDYNDAHGHPAGDDLLRRFAAAAGRAVRAADTVARWGGEEFAMALPCCPPDEAERVLARVAATVPDGQTCSIGYAVWDGRQTAEELTAAADRALYAAKSSGRDRVTPG